MDRGQCQGNEGQVQSAPGAIGSAFDDQRKPGGRAVFEITLHSKYPAQANSYRGSYMQTSGFLKPRIIDVQGIAPNHAKVVMEPFERGYGHTLGNALRRVLLSSMPGFAATEVQIAGVLHEYSTIEGVQEDVVDILLNLNGVVLKLHNREDALLNLQKKGEGPVTAGDIEATHDVEIINPEHVIAHLSPAGNLEIKIKAKNAPGTIPGNLPAVPEKSKATAKTNLNPSFSPAKRVSYSVDSARVEQRTDLDKLIIDIETNGVIEPEEAIRYAAR